jgi:Transglycosylase SLT domain
MAAIDWSKLSLDQLNIAEKIVMEAEKQGVDPSLALSFANIESNYSQSAKSSAGAIGVMQLMPGTAKDLNVDPNDLDQNITGGIKYIKQNYDKYKDPYLTAIAYNAGPSVADKFSVSKDPSILPAETVNYVSKLGDLYTPTVNVTSKETPQADQLTETKPGGYTPSDSDKFKLATYGDIDPDKIALATSIGAGLTTILAPELRAGKLGVDVIGNVIKRAFGGGVTSGFGAYAGESFKVGQPENAETDLAALGVELVASGGLSLGTEAVKRVPAVLNFIPGVSKITGALKTVTGGATEAETWLKNIAFGPKTIKGGTSTNTFRIGTENANRTYLSDMGIQVGKDELASTAVRNLLKKEVDDYYKAGVGFYKSKEKDALILELQQGVKNGSVTRQEYVDLRKFFSSQSTDLAEDATRFSSDLLNLAQQSKGQYGKIPLGETAQDLVTKNLDNYFMTYTNKPLYSTLKKVEADRFTAEARDSIPTLIKGGFPTDVAEKAMFNIKRSASGTQDFKIAIGSYFKTLPESKLIEEFNRLEPILIKTKIVPMDEINAIKKGINLAKSPFAKAGALTGVALKDAIVTGISSGLAETQQEKLKVAPVMPL